MASMIRIEKVTGVDRDEHGVAWSWVAGEELLMAKSLQEFYNFIDMTDEPLESIVAFTGSASLIRHCNEYIAERIRHENAV